MASYEIRGRLTRSARSLMILAVAAPSVCFPQPPPDSIAERQREIIERIEQEESRNGSQSASLIGPLAALALFYQENGDHGLASATTERVRQIVRANYGLFSLEQAPLIQQLIASAEASGDLEGAWALEQELLRLARRNPDDLRAVSIYRELADKRIDTLKRFLSGSVIPPEILLGCYYDRWRRENCHAGSKSQAAAAVLTDAVRHYRHAIDVFLRNEQYASDELEEIELDILRNCYLYRERLGFLGAGENSLSRACAIRQSLRRLLGYHVANSDPWRDQVEAQVRMADWDLLSSSNRSALDAYERAYEQLTELGVEQSFIDQTFSPTIPVVLPDFVPNPLVSQQKPESTGHIDVAFEITRYGVSRRVEILDATTNATDAAKDSLVDLIRASRFRPRLIDGRFQTSHVTVRYYLNE